MKRYLLGIILMFTLLLSGCKTTEYIKVPVETIRTEYKVQKDSIYLHDSINVYTETKGERSAKEGFFIGVFATHVGSWMIDTGVIGSILISLLFAILCCLVTSEKYTHKW